MPVPDDIGFFKQSTNYGREEASQPMSAPSTTPRLRDANGLYSMVAVDQRESLRAMLAATGEFPVSDERMRAFKVAVARALSPVASAILVDVDYALQPILDADALAPGCDLIVAIDVIDYDDAGVAQATWLRSDLLGRRWDERVAGLKFLLLWTPGEWLGCDRVVVQQFIDEARKAGLESVLEVIVRETDGSSPIPERQAELIVSAAKDLADMGATLYKAEVPFRNLASAEEVTRVSRELSAVIQTPWVVLSGGVNGDDFPDAVERTAAGGAEGFLAGRAVWQKATALAGWDATDYLRKESVETLAELRAALRSGRRITS
jgi:sulfofructosephosphate aldolase